MNRFLQKIIVIIITLTSCLSVFCSCADSEKSANTVELKKLVIGVDFYEPYIYLNADGEFSGFDVEIAKEVCRHIGYQPQFVHIDWGSKMANLIDGEIDCVWSCFTRTGRENDYSWTLPYMKSRQSIAVKKDSAIYSISDIENKKVAVPTTTITDEFFSGKITASKMEVPKIKELHCFSQMNYIFSALKSDSVDAIATHQLVLEEYNNSNSFDMRILDQPLFEVDIAVAFLKGTHSEDIKSINDTLILLKNNGFLAQLFSDKGLNPDLYLVDYEQE